MKIFRKIGPFLLIPLMLFSTIGFSIEIHYCGGEIESIGLYNAAPCEMEASMNQVQDYSHLPPCHQKKLKEAAKSNNKNGFNTGKCCHDESFNFEINPDLESPTTNLTVLSQVQAILIYTLVDFNMLQTQLQRPIYRQYKPPLIDEDLAILHQVFRI